MGAMASQITGVSIGYLTVFQVQINENIKAPRHWLLWVELFGDRWIPRSNAKNVSIWWHHYVKSSRNTATICSAVWFTLDNHEPWKLFIQFTVYW